MRGTSLIAHCPVRFSHTHPSPSRRVAPFPFSFLLSSLPFPPIHPPSPKMSFASRIALRQLTRVAPRSFSVLARQTTLAQVPRAAACKVNHPLMLMEPRKNLDWRSHVMFSHFICSPTNSCPHFHSTFRSLSPRPAVSKPSISAAPKKSSTSAPTTPPQNSSRPSRTTPSRSSATAPKAAARPSTCAITSSTSLSARARAPPGTRLSPRAGSQVRISSRSPRPATRAPSS